jgi:aerobic C4-dicarboxylate transport protein
MTSVAVRDEVEASRSGKKPWYKVLYIQVLIAIVLGVLVGWLLPDLAKNDWIKALGDGFIKLIKMVIAPIIFCTVVSGIAHIQDAKKVGRVGIKALVYFEIVSTFALIIGLLVGNLVRPGAGFSGTPDRQLSPAMPSRRPSRSRSTSFSTSSRTASWAPLLRATSCRCSCSRFCSAFRCLCSASAVRRSAAS